MKERKGRISSVGVVSLITIFSVLTLTVFAILSISTVRTQSRLSAASRHAIETYYEADTQAEMILAHLKQGQIPQGVTEEAGVYHFSCPMSHGQALVAEVDSSDYAILRWQVVSAEQWDGDASIDVWSGEGTGN